MEVQGREFKFNPFQDEDVSSDSIRQSGSSSNSPSERNLFWSSGSLPIPIDSLSPASIDAYNPSPSSSTTGDLERSSSVASGFESLLELKKVLPPPFLLHPSAMTFPPSVGPTSLVKAKYSAAAAAAGEGLDLSSSTPQHYPFQSQPPSYQKPHQILLGHPKNLASRKQRSFPLLSSSSGTSTTLAEAFARPISSQAGAGYPIEHHVERSQMKGSTSLQAYQFPYTAKRVDSSASGGGGGSGEKLHQHKVTLSSVSAASSSTTQSSSSSQYANSSALSAQPSTSSISQTFGASFHPSQDSEPSTLPSQTQRQHQSAPLAPIAGFRIPAVGTSKLSSFPVLQLCGPAFADRNGEPVFVCSAILGTSVHPGKAGPHYFPPVRIGLDGREEEHGGRYDLLPITSEMKWISASHGILPQDHAPVQGGYEESSEQLFHAVAKLDGLWVPGKTGKHLKGALFALEGKEVFVEQEYRVLCWKNRMRNADQIPHNPSAHSRTPSLQQPQERRDPKTPGAEHIPPLASYNSSATYP